MKSPSKCGFLPALILSCLVGFVSVSAVAQDSPSRPSTSPAQTAPAASPPPEASAKETAPAAAAPAPKATEPSPAAATSAEKPASPPLTAAQPDSAGSHPATATTPAIPAPGAKPPAAKPGDDASAAAPGPRKEVVGTGSALLPHDLSPYGMFMNADIVVKSVMVGLIFASLVTWTIFLAKTLELTAAKMRAKKALNQLAESGSLGEAVAQLKPPKAPVTRLAQAALAETERSRGLSADGVKERATALLARIEARAGRATTRGTGLLATIGSTAPFVGLFGTVWGIMNSFIGISKTNTTNLAVVAPGIAEALLATACGLVAAIPAVIIYNVFARSISGYRSVLNDASAEVLRLLSRDLDRETGSDGVVPMSRRAAE